MSWSKPFYVLNEDGCFGPVIVPRQIQNAQQIFAQTAQKQGIKLPNLFTVDSRVASGVAYHNRLLLSFPVPKIDLKTYYAVSPDSAALLPYFQRGTDRINLALEWVPPSDMLITLAFDMTREPTLGVWDIGEAYFFVKKVGTTGTNGTFALPLTNIYSDGRLCLGTMPRDHAPTAEQLARRVLEHFESSTWNMNGEGEQRLFDSNWRNCHALFRWDVATRQQLPVPANWQDHCRRVSRVEIEDLCS